MEIQITPQCYPDFAASGWLKFGAFRSMSGDPTTLPQFVSTCSFLTAITYHFTEIAGPWFATTPQEICEIHSDYLLWCHVVSHSDAIRLLPESTPFSLRNLAALSTRRMQAITEFGGKDREDYPIYSHLHSIILSAAFGVGFRRTKLNASAARWHTLEGNDPTCCLVLS